MPDLDYEMDLFDEATRTLLANGWTAERLREWVSEISEEMAERQDQNRQQNR